ncbi:cysteine proteinase [Hymenopellis radicata]|nr:cysteine proteinase [Hymenopellis radicata]
MAPKRRTRASSPDNGLAPGQVLKRGALSDNSASPWAWVGTEAIEASQITLEHRLMSCGLSQRNRHPFCRNTLKPKSKAKEPLTSVAADDVIVISDDDEPTCSKKLCKSNPNCLNYINVDTWANREKAREEFFKAIELGDDPMDLSREPDLPVGLRNLGATCYANASLQVWYRDETFRRAVYACQAQPGAEEAFKNSPLHQLQITFAALQECTQNVFNPVKLVESLKLNTGEQQDAQEFSKLFLNHLDLEFKKQSSPALAALVDTHFQGKKVYGTMCDACGYQSERPDDFREIEINFKNNAKLEDRITAYLKPEKLNGDNQYFCSQCNSKQDATRYTKFQHLPPVLNFSLLRFVYDFDKMERRKSKNGISFPLEIDMGRFIGDSATRKAAPQNSDEQSVYELRGVLLHKGSSAYHGHYEAQVYDASSKTWFQFNDEEVSRIKKLGKPPVETDVIDLATDGESRPRPKKLGKRRRVDDSDDELAKTPESPKSSPKPKPPINEVSSKDAYMLIYTKRTASDAVPPDEISPPPNVMEVVKELNAKYEEACEEFANKQKVAERHLWEKRRTVIDIYRSWSVESTKEDSAIVSRRSLDEWLTKGALKDAADTFSSKPKPDQDAASETPLSIEDIVCEHGLLNPDKTSDMKRIKTCAFQRITSETNCRFEKEFTPEDVCTKCIEAIFQEQLYDIRHPQEVNRFDSFMTEDPTRCGYWISKAWLKDWKLAKPKMHVWSEGDPSPSAAEYDRHVRCEHGELTLNALSRRLIPVEACEVLTELFPDWLPFSSEAQTCEVCSTIIKFSKEDKMEFRKKAENEKAKLKHLINVSATEVEAPEYALVPIIFLKAWRQWLTSPTNAERPTKVDNAPFICEHSHLVFDPNRRVDWEFSHSMVALSDWRDLESFYTAGPLISVRKEADGVLLHEIPVCESCRRKRKLDWDEAGIFVCIGGKNGKVSNGTSESTSRKNGARQSKRLRQVKEQGERRQFTVTKHTTLMEIKLMVDKEFNISPIFQRLYHEGRELTDNKATVSSLDILKEDIIELREEKEILEISDTDDGPDAKKRRKDEEKGFGGTLLSGCVERSHSREKTENAESESSLPSSKPCSACTFENEPDATSCAICDTQL